MERHLKFWKKKFAVRHIQELNLPVSTPFVCGHPEGIVFLTGGEFVLLTPKERKVLHTGQSGRYLKWFACARGIVDLSRLDAPLCFNEEIAKPFYKGPYDKEDGVVATPSGCAVLNNGKIFLPFETEPILYTEYDEVLSHPMGLLIRKDRTCSILILK